MYISRHNQHDNISVQETSALAYICIMSKSVLIMVVLISQLIYVILVDKCMDKKPPQSHIYDKIVPIVNKGCCVCQRLVIVTRVYQLRNV